MQRSSSSPALAAGRGETTSASPVLSGAPPSASTSSRTGPAHRLRRRRGPSAIAHSSLPSEVLTSHPSFERARTASRRAARRAAASVADVDVVGDGHGDGSGGSGDGGVDGVASVDGSALSNGAQTPLMDAETPSASMDTGMEGLSHRPVGRRRNRLRCLEFDVEGRYVMREMTRQEIIDEAVVAAGPAAYGNLALNRGGTGGNAVVGGDLGGGTGGGAAGMERRAAGHNLGGVARSPGGAAGQGMEGSGRSIAGEGRPMRGMRGMRGKAGIGRHGTARGSAAVAKAAAVAQAGRMASSGGSALGTGRAGKTMNALTMRDIRQVDPAFTAKAALWVRQNAMVVSLESVRAIILHNKMFLFNPDSPETQRPIRYIRERLADGARNVEQAFVPFELRALEGILIHTCILLEKQFTKIEPVLMLTLEHLPTHINAEHLEQLRIHEQSLNHFLARAKKVKYVLQALLEDDDDMAGMYLTEKHKSPDTTRNPLDHDEAEVLVEAYLQVCDSVLNSSELLNRAIDDTENLVEIHLDTMQNQLLLVNLLISVITTIFSFGTMVTGIFGMNLVLPAGMSSLPTSQYYFYGCAGLLAVSMPLGLFVLMRWSKSRGLYAPPTRHFRPFRSRNSRPEPGPNTPAAFARQKVDRMLNRRRQHESPRAELDPNVEYGLPAASTGDGFS